MLEKVKKALQLTDDIFDDDILCMIEEAKKDMAFAGIDEKEVIEANTDYAYEQAIVLFCIHRFELLHGSVNRAENIEKIYKEQKRMLGMATGYTDWGEND